jgi:GntR family transcriptional repressor for pyruvate dehydrogenase complex
MAKRRTQGIGDVVDGVSAGGQSPSGRADPPAHVAIPIAPGTGLTRPPKRAETVARDLVRDIVRQGRQPGDALSSEAAMVEEYAVSRESLREALRLLEVQGLVAIRRGPGGGPSVCTVDPANLGRISTLYFHMAGATYRELSEAWVLAESLLAGRAARNPHAEIRLAAMLPYLQDRNGSSDADADVTAFMHTHMSFHARVASLVQNRVLEITLQTMGQIVSHHVVVTDDPRGLGRDLGDDHRRIAVAIVAGLADQASSIMEEHISAIARAAGEHLGPRFDDLIEWQ